MIATIIPFDSQHNTQICIDFCSDLKSNKPLNIVLFDSKDEFVVEHFDISFNDYSIYHVENNPALELSQLASELTPSVIVHTVGNKQEGSRVPDAETASKYIHQLKQNFLLIPFIPEIPQIKTIVFPIHIYGKVRHKVSLTAQLAKYTGAKIHVANILTNSHRSLEKRCILYGNQVSNHLKSLGIETSISNHQNKSLANGIAEIIEEVNGDLLSIIPESDTGPSFYGKNFIQEVIKDIKVPILVFAPRKSKISGSFKTSG